MRTLKPSPRLASAIFLSVVACVVSNTELHANSCGFPGWEASLSDADIVFQGTKVSHVVVPFLVNSTTFEVRQVWKGPVVTRYRLQHVPDPLISTLVMSPDYGEGDYIVLANVNLNGVWDNLCVPTVNVKQGVDPELRSLLGNGIVPNRSPMSLLDRVPGWGVLGFICVLSAIWGFVRYRRIGPATSCTLRANLATIVGGVTGGALLAPSLLVSQTAGEWQTLMSRAPGDAVAAATLFGLGGGIYGAFLGLFIGPACSAVICIQPSSQHTRACGILGTVIGFLVGWSILGTLFLHGILAIGAFAGLFGGLAGSFVLGRSPKDEVVS